METKTFIEWIRIMQLPMVIDHELTYHAVNSQRPDTKTMTVFYRKGTHLLAMKVIK